MCFCRVSRGRFVWVRFCCVFDGREGFSLGVYSLGFLGVGRVIEVERLSC